MFIIGHLRGAGGRPVFPIFGKNGTTNQANIKQIGNINNSTSFGGNPQTGRVYDIEGISPTLNTMQGGGREPKVAIPALTPDRVNKRQNGRRFKNNGEPMFTLTAQDRHGVVVSTNSLLTSENQGVVTEVLKGCDEVAQVAKKVEKYANAIRPNAKPIVRITSQNDIRGARQDSKKTGLSELQFTNPCNPCGTVIASHVPKTWDKELRIRKLTPRECWRLQAFPDWAFDKAQEVNSKTQLYKQAGNSVTVNVIKAIAEKLEE